MTEKTAFANLHAYFGYRDAPAALRWLERAFGFRTTMEFPDDDGGIMHAELRRDNVAILVFSHDDGSKPPATEGETVGHGLYVNVPDAAVVDAVFASAVAAGATVAWEPGDNEWGSYRFRVRDPEGYEWTFGTHTPGLEQEWSG